MAEPDHDFLATLWDRHADQVYAYARRRVGASDAPDVVAEVFAVAVAKRAKVPDEALPWLYRTAWANGEWEPLLHLPADLTGAVTPIWTGRRLIVWGAESGAELVDGKWRSLPE